MIKTVSSFDLRDNLSRYLELVREEETPLLIERYGQPVAIISPFTSDYVKRTNFDDYFGFLAGNETGEEYLKKVRRCPREKKRIESRRAGL